MSQETGTDGDSSPLSEAMARSRVVGLVGAGRDRLSALDGKPGATLIRTVHRFVTHSYVYRWLTVEPNPEAIVIDIRKTYIVGSLIAFLDLVVGWLDAAATSSGAVAVGRSLLAEFRAAPVRLFGAVVALGSATALLVGLVAGTLDSPRILVLVVLTGAGLVGTRITASWTNLADSWMGRVLIAIFEPPAETSSPARDVDERSACRNDGSRIDSSSPDE